LIKDREARIQTAREVAETLSSIAERLSRAGPQRRSSDRRARPSPRPSRPPGLLPAAAIPLGVRLWQLARSGAAPRVLAVSGAIGGTAVGLAIGVAIARGEPEAVSAPQSAAAPPRRDEPLVTPVDAPRELESAGTLAPRDLSDAVAKGLGVGKRRHRPKLRPVEAEVEPEPEPFALAPRKNPY
jgi:hypothetical protein